jgi:hypothetical protein
MPVIEANWGEAILFRTLIKDADLAADARLVAWWKRMERLSASPSTAARIIGSTLDYDARPFLADVRAPVLLLHDAHNQMIAVDGMRWLAAHYLMLS